MSADVKGRRTDQGWVPYSDKVGVGAHRCVFDGSHKATDHSSQEITHTMLYGKGRRGEGGYIDVTRMLHLLHIYCLLTQIVCQQSLLDIYIYIYYI